MRNILLVTGVVILLSCTNHKIDTIPINQVESFKGFTCFFYRGKIFFAATKKFDRNHSCNPLFIDYSKSNFLNIDSSMNVDLIDYHCKYDTKQVLQLTKEFLNLNKEYNLKGLTYDTATIIFFYSNDLPHKKEVIYPLNKEAYLDLAQNKNYYEKNKYFYLK